MLGPECDLTLASKGGLGICGAALLLVSFIGGLGLTSVLIGQGPCHTHC